MVTLFNESSSFGMIYNAVNTNITGSVFLTLLLIVFAIILLFLAFRLPLEASAILVLPLLITFLAFESSLYTIGGVTLIYLGVLWAKNWLIG